MMLKYTIYMAAAGIGMTYTVMPGVELTGIVDRTQ
jgi:hypothetical protein